MEHVSVFSTLSRPNLSKLFVENVALKSLVLALAPIFTLENKIWPH